MLGSAPSAPHRHQLALTIRIQAHDIDGSGQYNVASRRLISQLASKVQKLIDLLPGIILREPPTHVCFSILILAALPSAHAILNRI
jgi:hypothetical protein